MRSLAAHIRFQRPSWRLRTGLLVPIFLLVPLFLAVSGVLWEGVARREAETLVAQRQQAALAGLSAQLQERRQTASTIAYLVSKREGLGTAIEDGNTLRLVQTLIVLHSALGVGYIDLYDSNGELLLHFGETASAGIDGHLVGAAILGHDTSAVGSNDDGLVVSAAAAVAGGRNGTAGVLVVGISAAASVLSDEPAAEAVAVFRHGRLVDTSIDRPDVRAELNGTIASLVDVEALNAALAPMHMRAAGLGLSLEDLVVAIVPIDDLDRASQQRTELIAGGALALLIALSLISLIQARAIARPLENLVGVAGKLVRGEYVRVGSSSNFEVNALGRAVNHLADQLESKLGELTHHAMHDSLSGLPNRKSFLRRLEETLAVADGRGVAVLFLDLDSFKMVNDSLGHAAGDQLIVAVTERLRATFAMVPGLRATIARFGGDEFTILLPQVDDDVTVRRVVERLTEALAQPFAIGSHEIVVSASIGIARSTPQLSVAEDLVQAADVAMYRAKAAGRGKYVVYESAMGRRAAERLDQEMALRQAIETGALRVYYQPIVDLASGRVHEVEALVRWIDPQRGVIAPAEFIPLAEQTGLIVPLGLWVLEEACRQLRVWHLERPSEPLLTLNVNLSARQLQQADLVNCVRRVLEVSQIPPACLTLEITESCLLQESGAGQLRSLATLGINLAIDDFGTGYSSLSSLSRLPINTLKIDRSFVAVLGRDPESTALVQTIVALAEALRLNVTAEGIEHPEQAAQLRALGCSRGQGFLYARPLPASELELDPPATADLAA